MKRLTFKWLVVLFPIVFDSCKSQSPSYKPFENQLSILIFQDTLAYYNGLLDKKTGTTIIPFDEVTFKELIEKNKKTYGDSLIVVLKLTDKVRFLDQVEKISNIIKDSKTRLSGWSLSNADILVLGLKDFVWEPPSSFFLDLESADSIETIALLVELHADKSIGFKQMTSWEDTNTINIGKPININLKKVIAAYKSSADERTVLPNYFIKGDRGEKFTSFKIILEAFKQNDIYKYNLISSYNDIIHLIEKSKNPSSLDLYLPKEEKSDQIRYDDIETKLTLLLLNDSIVYGYEGNNFRAGKSYQFKDVRQVIINSSKKFKEDFVVIIKPTLNSTYKDNVAILDEMSINKIKKFAMIELTDEENEFIKNL